MRRHLSVLLVTASLLWTAPARADITLLTATSDGSSEVKSIGPATTVTVSVQSAAGSVAVVTIEQKLPKSDSWFTCATITNPSITGEIWKGPGGGLIRVTVSGYASGTIKVILEAYAGMNLLY